MSLPKIVFHDAFQCIALRKLIKRIQSGGTLPHSKNVVVLTNPSYALVFWNAALLRPF
jgi:hypothetical protein